MDSQTHVTGRKPPRFRRPLHSFRLRTLFVGRKFERQPWFMVTWMAFGALFGLLSVWSGPLNASPVVPIVMCTFAGLVAGVVLDLAASRP